MFCNICGYKIPDDSQFCSKCGTPQVPIEENKTATLGVKKGLDRAAVIIYLENVLTLEYAIDILNKKWSSINKIILDFESTNYREIVSISDKEQVGLFYDGQKYYMHFNIATNGNAFIGLKWGPFYEICWEAIDDNWDYINETRHWPSTYKSSSMLLDLFLVAPIVETSQKRAKKKSFLEAYESFKRRAPGRYIDNLKKIKPEQDKRSGIEKEAQTAKELLDKAYSTNIIPQQFRNIYAVWFIHNYLSTSNETLTSALLHCDLDNIKQKLDTIIDQQRDIIMNQAILAAQNNQIMEQNQRSLKHLAAIEQNVEISAQYSQIAANNAEACAWIGVANYLQ